MTWLKPSALFFAATLLTATGNAGTIELVSSAATTTNDSGYATLNISPNPAWASPFAGSSWVSDALTGDPSTPGFTVLPNGTWVHFSEAFTLNGPVVNANLMVLADDTSSVAVNGSVIYNAALNPAGGYPRCSSQTIGCLASTEGIFNTASLAPYLKEGDNVITFGVVQKNGSSFGLDYAGSITTSPTPEPGSTALIGIGLIALSILRGRRKASNRAGSAV